MAGRLKDGVFEAYHLDHLGNRVAATDANGDVVWREDYTPFGERLTDPSAKFGEPDYTGHVYDARTGLTYMQARHFDPIIGRFLSTDPIGYQDQFNLYAYVANDPVNKFDPDGRCGAAILHCLGAAGGAIAGLTGEIASLTVGNTPSVGGFVGAATGGAAAGVVFVNTRGNFAAAGAVAAGVDSTVRQSVDNTIAAGGNLIKGIGGVNVAEVATETTIGAAAGKIGLPKIPKITSGQGSITHVANTQSTLLSGDPARNISTKTAGKIVAAGAIGDTPEAAAAAVTGDLVNAAGNNFSDATLGNGANCALAAAGCE